MQEAAEEHMLRLGDEQMSEADSPRAHALALLMSSSSLPDASHSTHVLAVWLRI